MAKKNSSKTSHTAVWQELKEKFSNTSPQSYSIDGSFSVNATIDHSHFGLGIVTSSFANKIEVCFEEGVKALVHRQE